MPSNGLSGSRSPCGWRAAGRAGSGGALALLDEAQEDLASATEELRELARGLHPAVLTDGGLGPALRGLVARLPLEVTMTGVPEGRLPIDVELDRVLRCRRGAHQRGPLPGTNRAQVDFAMANGNLAIEVRDFGRGGANLEGGTGLRGLEARVAVHEGTLSVPARPARERPST